MSVITQIFGLDSSHTKPTQTLFGIECEIESIRDCNLPEEWEAKQDGSLRNNGMEYVSVPMCREDAVGAFQELHRSLDIRRPEEKFSPRTSIHVHVNCKNLEDTHVRNVVLMYALFEELFFLQVDPSRRENIHCVALNETHLPARYSHRLQDLWSIWSKYTALNLKPLSVLGTLEFRHSDGHDDAKRFDDWLKCIEQLFSVAKTTQLSPTTVTQEHVQLMADQIFGHLPNYPSLRMRLFGLVQNSLIDVKLSFS